MKRPEWRARWKRAVYARHPGFTLPDGTGVAPLSDATRVLLLRLLEDMDSGGYVSVPRSRLAEEFGVPPARITERVKLARQHGFLYPVRAARLGRSCAVYQAVFPSRRGTSGVPLADAVEVRPPVPLIGTSDVPVVWADPPAMSDLEVRQGIPICKETPADSGTSRHGQGERRDAPTQGSENARVAVDRLTSSIEEEEWTA